MEGHTDSRQFWHQVYMEHSPSILAFLTHRLGDRTEAEDLLQDTFVKAIRAEDNLRDPNKLRSYLFSVAHNLMINHVRKKRPTSITQGAEFEEDPFEQVTDPEQLAPDAEADMAELNRQVERTLQQMSERYRVAFQLGVLEGRTYNEICRSTGWNLGQVKINIHRARKLMIDSLSDGGFLDER